VHDYISLRNTGHSHPCTQTCAKCECVHKCVHNGSAVSVIRIGLGVAPKHKAVYLTNGGVCLYEKRINENDK